MYRKLKIKAFTLIELLVVIAVISLLIAMSVQALAAAKTHARKIICRTNLRQLHMANAGYAAENNDFYVPAASDMNDPKPARRNLARWHGKRQTINDPFDGYLGPLSAYLDGGKVTRCPQAVRFVKGQPWDANYEDGAGGYGYNATYIGSRNWDKNYAPPESDRKTTRSTEVKIPSETLMFSDCAMAKVDPDGQAYYIETSFAWQVFVVYNGMTFDGQNGTFTMYQSPTIHFRHRGAANIAWVDGHIDQQLLAAFEEENVYGVESCNYNLGWFDPLNNSPFDVK